MVKRRDTFTVDAESVQGIAGATVTFKRIKRHEFVAWRDDPTQGDGEILETHLVDWSGIVDGDGNELPSPKDEPGVFGELFQDELPLLSTLLIQGPNGPDALKN